MRYLSFFVALATVFTLGAGDFQAELQRELRRHPFKAAERGDRITIAVNGKIVYGRVKAVDNSGVTMATLLHPGGIFYPKHQLNSASRALLYRADHEAYWRERVADRHQYEFNRNERRDQFQSDWDAQQEKLRRSRAQRKQNFADFKADLKNSEHQNWCRLTRIDELRVVEIIDRRHFMAIPAYQVTVPGTSTPKRLVLPLSCFEGDTSKLYCGKTVVFRRTARLNEDFSCQGKVSYQPAVGKSFEVYKYKIYGL